jgi:hypothetical protein
MNKKEALKETGKNLQALANLLLVLSFVNLYLNNKIDDILVISIGFVGIAFYIIGYKLIKGIDNE